MGLLTLLACLSVAASTGRSVAAVRQKIDLQVSKIRLCFRSRVYLTKTRCWAHSIAHMRLPWPDCSRLPLPQNPNPGMPSKMSVIIINTAADDLNLITSTVGAGAWLYQPPATVARYGAPGTFNYGYTQLAPLGGGPINSTVTYRAPTSGDAADEPAFADLFLFSIRGEFGLSVSFCPVAHPSRRKHRESDLKQSRPSPIEPATRSCFTGGRCDWTGGLSPCFPTPATPTHVPLSSLAASQVESSERAATVTVNGGLVGNDKVTEAIYVVNIAPPPNATRLL